MSSDREGGHIKKPIEFIDNVFQRYTPDAFVIAVFLTYLVLVLAYAFGVSDISSLIGFWGEGIWSLIPFTLQMAMVLFGGFIMATAPPVQAALTKISGLPKTNSQAVLFITIVSCFCCYLNWGFGLVVASILATKLASALPHANYRLLVASGYSGFVVWHGGLSGSIPLLLNTPGNFSEAWLGGLIPLSQTMFSPFNLILVLSVAAVLLATNFYLSKHTYQPVLLNLDETLPSDNVTSPAEKFENSPVSTIALCLLGFSFLVLQIFKDKFSLDLNTVNFLFLFTGILLHWRTKSFLNHVGKAASNTGPILVQYPLYAGIMGVMIHSGLAKVISEFFISVSSSSTLPLFTFLSAGLVNIFIPSGGGQWAVQGPIVVPAIEALGANMTKTLMAVAWGDAWTNLLQPFWALPLLAIAGLKVKDIMTYCVILLITSGSVLMLLFYVL